MLKFYPLLSSPSPVACCTSLLLSSSSLLTLLHLSPTLQPFPTLPAVPLFKSAALLYSLCCTSLQISSPSLLTLLYLSSNLQPFSTHSAVPLFKSPTLLYSLSNLQPFSTHSAAPLFSTLQSFLTDPAAPVFYFPALPYLLICKSLLISISSLYSPCCTSLLHSSPSLLIIFLLVLHYPPCMPPAR
jgi:hypothetical protein